MKSPLVSDISRGVERLNRGRVAEESQIPATGTADQKSESDVASTQRVQTIQFPEENAVNQFRAELEGRQLYQPAPGTPLSTLEGRVNAFQGNEASLQAPAVVFDAEGDFLPIIGDGGDEGQETTQAPVEFNSDGTMVERDPSGQPKEDPPLKAIEGKEGKEEQSAADTDKPRGRNGKALTDQELREVQKLEQRDQEVRTHEQAHVSAGGQYVRGGAKLSYETGPDGKRYATSGHVNIDVSAERNPEMTIKKMRVVQQAALAPAQPSGADRAVAAAASRKELDARQLIADRQRMEAELRRQTQLRRSEAAQRDQRVEEKSAAPEAASIQAEGAPAQRTQETQGSTAAATTPAAATVDRSPQAAAPASTPESAPAPSETSKSNEPELIEVERLGSMQLKSQEQLKSQAQLKSESDQRRLNSDDDQRRLNSDEEQRRLNSDPFNGNP